MKRININEELNRSHKLLCRAAALVNTQLTKRRFRHADCAHSMLHCEEAVAIMLRLVQSVKSQ